ncbi:hypothetical protein LCGC14_1760350, partial [marine sediment metagenome]
MGNKKERVVSYKKKEIKKINLEGEDWYESLIGECEALWDAVIFNYKMTMMEGMHKLGLRILEENDNFKRSRIYGKEIVKQVAQSVRMGERMIYYGIRFYKKFPDLNQFLSSVSEGENISMRKIIMRYLTEPDKAREE